MQERCHEFIPRGLRFCNGGQRIGISTPPPGSIAVLFDPCRSRVSFRNLTGRAENGLKARAAPATSPNVSCRTLPGNTLVEFIVRCRLGLRIGFPLGLPGNRQLPKWRATGRGQAGGRGGLAQMLENVANHRAFVDESDDRHVAAAPGADQRQHFVDARQQKCPYITRRRGMT